MVRHGPPAGSSVPLLCYHAWELFGVACIPDSLAEGPCSRCANPLLVGDLLEALREEIGRLPALLGLVLVDLARGGRCSLRGDEVFPAASLMKVPILLEVLRRAAEEGLDLEDSVALRARDRVGGAGVLFELHEGTVLTLRDLARLMIVVSDNTASNLLLDRVSMEGVNRLMKRLGMSRSVLRRKFMQPGPENLTTPADMARCLEALWRGEVLPASWREEALEILRRQQYREKIPLLLPPDLPVAHKTGELEGVRHDAALVELPGRPYLLVLLTREGGAAWEVDLGLARIARLCYDWFCS